VVDGSSEPARAAWCYGDPGVAVALLGAARAVGHATWEEAALAIARRAALRSFESSGVLDAGLCHGAAGLAHLFNRMYQMTGDPLLGDAARAWFERTLAMRQPHQGLAGYRSFEPERTDAQWVDDPSLFTGVGGIALALLGAISPLEPRWDRLLLASLPSTAECAP
jgi:lantibiotic modifying enzyme